MIAPALYHSKQSAVVLFVDVFCRRIEKRVKQTSILFRLPVIMFEFVARVAAVDKIIRGIISTLSAGLKVIISQFRTNISFRHAAITTAKVITGANRLPQSVPHQLDLLTLLIRWYSASMAWRSAWISARNS